MDPSRDAEQVARARLAYVSAGKQPLCAPRRAMPEEPEEPAGHTSDRRVDQESRAAVAPALPVPRRLTRQHLLVVAVLLLCGVGVAVAALTRSAATEVPVPAPSVVSAAPPSPSPTPMLRVHVAGEVVSPGVVTVPDGAIVLDAVDAAGGLADTADPADLNLAAPVSDGMQILIGSRDDPRGEVSGASGTDAGPGVLLDLNRATAAELEELPGVGPVTAGAIIAWREDNGEFTSVDELQEVSGIGPATLEKLRPLVTV